MDRPSSDRHSAVTDVPVPSRWRMISVSLQGYFLARSDDGCRGAGRASCRSNPLATSAGRGNQQTPRTRRETTGRYAQEETLALAVGLGLLGVAGIIVLAVIDLRPHFLGHAGNPDRRPERARCRETERRAGRGGRRQVRLEDQSQLRPIRIGPAGQHGSVSARSELGRCEAW